MAQEIGESDWRLSRQLREVALDRYCRRVLSESERLHGDQSLSAHQRYLAIFKLLKQRDKELASLFDDPRRSVALYQLAGMKGHGLLTDEELARFSEATQYSVAVLSEAVSD